MVMVNFPPSVLTVFQNEVHGSAKVFKGFLSGQNVKSKTTNTYDIII